MFCQWVAHSLRYNSLVLYSIENNKAKTRALTQTNREFLLRPWKFWSMLIFVEFAWTKLDPHSNVEYGARLCNNLRIFHISMGLSSSVITMLTKLFAFVLTLLLLLPPLPCTDYFPLFPLTNDKMVIRSIEIERLRKRKCRITREFGLHIADTCFIVLNFRPLAQVH